MPGTHRFVGGYMCFGAAYGLVRSAYLTHGACIKEHVSFYPIEHKVRPMLMAEKAPVCVIGTTVSSFYWPYYVLRDAYDLELSIRGLVDEFGDEDRSNKVYANALDVVFG